MLPYNSLVLSVVIVVTFADQTTAGLQDVFLSDQRGAGLHNESLSDPKSAGGAACPADWLDASFVSMGCLWLSADTAYSWVDGNKYCQDLQLSIKGALIEVQTSQQMAFL